MEVSKSLRRIPPLSNTSQQVQLDFLILEVSLSLPKVTAMGFFEVHLGLFPTVSHLVLNSQYYLISFHVLIAVGWDNINLSHHPVPIPIIRIATLIILYTGLLLTQDNPSLSMIVLLSIVIRKYIQCPKLKRNFNCVTLPSNDAKY